jgi:hypothetical protein
MAASQALPGKAGAEPGEPGCLCLGDRLLLPDTAATLCSGKSLSFIHFLIRTERGFTDQFLRPCVPCTVNLGGGGSWVFLTHTCYTDAPRLRPRSLLTTRALSLQTGSKHCERLPGTMSGLPHGPDRGPS